jgi:GDP/UDP-N,N'-diacetylbacillosamine 2-epimerase (hydrolysing)
MTRAGSHSQRRAGARRIVYVSGTRADFGLMCSTLLKLHGDASIDLSILVTGMHLDGCYGHTVDEIEQAGLPVLAKVPVPMQPTTAATMARNIGLMISAFVDVLESARPDAVLLLGDRGEMLAGAVAALHLGIAVIHVHGGERSGTVDEPIRHAISKLAHYHFVATPSSRNRLLRMGEAAECVFVTGAPGLDGLRDAATLPRAQLAAARQLDPTGSLALLMFHPVVQEADLAGTSIAAVLEGVLRCGCQVLALMPNADAGGAAIREILESSAGRSGVRLATHLPRQEFASWMAVADVMVGNSSAGIIEAATFGTPVVNVGSRQHLRERNANVTDVDVDVDAIAGAVARSLSGGRRSSTNVYGDGRSGERIAELLGTLALDISRKAKSNAY